MVGRAPECLLPTAHPASRVSRNILRYLGSDEFNGEGNWSDVRRKNARRDMDYFEPAVDALVAAGQSEVVAGERGKSIRLVGRK